MSAILSHTTKIRVRYCETDAMGFLHHGNYPAYFEEARTELFRVNGGDYRMMEEHGFFFVVVSMSFKFRKPARYDDLLDVTPNLERVTPVRLEHSYRVTREGLLLTEGMTTLTIVDRDGKVQPLSPEIPGIPDGVEI